MADILAPNFMNNEYISPCSPVQLTENILGRAYMVIPVPCRIRNLRVLLRNGITNTTMTFTLQVKRSGVESSTGIVASFTLGEDKAGSGAETFDALEYDELSYKVTFSGGTVVNNGYALSFEYVHTP